MMQPELAPAEAGARITLNPLSFGNNIDESLINPTEPGKSEAQLTEQVAGILHGVKMDGGRTVRWFVTSVWPQYLCARDPENQATGELDPAWFTISRILLQQAEKEGIAVVIVLADTTNGTFAGLSSNEGKRTSVIARWHQHHAALPTAAGGRMSTVECDRGFQNGYYGRMRPAEIFEDPQVQPLLAARFLKMAEFLKTFPALAALELFNEPDFAESQKPQFARTIAQIRHLLYSEDPSLRSIPIYSGVSAWNDKIVRSLAAAGELADEPYVNVHSYLKAGASAPVNEKWVGDLIAYLRRIVPDKPLIIAEAGASDSIHDLRVHSNVLHALLSAKKAGQVGMWMFGTFADDSGPQPDFKWEFTSSALSGGSFRDILAATDREHGYRYGKAVVFTSTSHAAHQEAVAISQIPADDANQLWRLRWQISIATERFIGISRAGILLRVSPEYKGVVSEPGSAIVIAAAEDGQWAQISQAAGDWQIKIFQCRDKAGTASIATPPYVPNYAMKLGNKSFKSCPQSSLLESALL
jgi:hypothetical protein